MSGRRRSESAVPADGRRFTRPSMSATEVELLVRGVIIHLELPFTVLSVIAAPAGIRHWHEGSEVLL